MIPIKCLTDTQMKVILAKHEGMTAQQLADELQIEKHKVTLFCQANAIELLGGRKRFRKRKPKKIIPVISAKINRFDFKVAVRPSRYY